MAETSPDVVVLAGPNGAGKSTIAESLLPTVCQIREFVNADVIARGLSGFDPDSVALQAGRIMLERLHELARQRHSFAFETTLATRTFAAWLKGLKAGDYRFRLVYVWLDSAELAILRVAERIAQGGHSIPPDVIERRYERSLSNLVQLYMPLADDWEILDNSAISGARIVASGSGRQVSTVFDQDVWTRIVSRVGAW